MITASNILIGTNWSYDYLGTVGITPLLGDTVSGSGSASDPYVYDFAVETDSSTVTNFQLPSITDRIACWMQPDTRVNGGFLTDISDLTSPAIFTLVSSTDSPPGSSASNEDLATKSTSKAININRLSILLTIIGVMSYHF